MEVQSPCYLSDLEGKVVTEPNEDRYLVLDGCLRNLKNVNLNAIFGAKIENFIPYPYGTMNKLRWPKGNAISSVQLIKYEESYYLLIDQMARKIDKEATITKYGFDRSQAITLKQHQMESLVHGSPVKFHSGVSSATYNYNK